MRQSRQRYCAYGGGPCLHGRWPSLAGWDRRVTRPFTGEVRPRALITTYSLQISPKVGQSYCRSLVLLEALLPGKVSWPTTLNLETSTLVYFHQNTWISKKSLATKLTNFLLMPWSIIHQNFLTMLKIHSVDARN